MDGVSVTQEWSYAGLENGESFTVLIKDGAVTVNGRKYDSLDEVPRAERERIDALRTSVAFESNRRWLAAHGEGYDGALVRVD
ncbi:hypothetical protein G6F68_020505 [Rhizopus microsporus]|nr:hypothetical protein G6F68_020505 [Rhizopus microsporus]